MRMLMYVCGQPLVNRELSSRDVEAVKTCCFGKLMRNIE